jgi:hypothetical protein
MNFCRTCFFALCFCACSTSAQKKLLDASDVALKTAECARDVAEEFLGKDATDPEVSIPLAAALVDCAPLPEIKLPAKRK